MVLKLNTEFTYLFLVIRSVDRLPARSTSPAPGPSARPLPSDVLEGQNLHLVVPQKSLLEVPGRGETVVHLEVVLFDTALQDTL